ncbi:uncharacterized protein ACIQIH_017273 isoform 1-T1 [Cyanocitta cristata]
MAVSSLTEPSSASREAEGPPSSLLFLLFPLFPCSADLALQETTLQRPGCSPGDGDGGRAVPAPVLSPAVVANQPTLTVEMSASAIPAPSSSQCCQHSSTSQGRRKQGEKP